jgi:MFS family permease
VLTWIRQHAIDVTPLRRHRDFRLLFIGQMVSFMGSMITFVALPFQIFQISHSSIAVGVLGVVEVVPMVIFSFVGGALADSVDRRWMVRITETALMLLIAVLALNAHFRHPQLWVLFLVVVGIMSADAIQRPSLDSLLPRLVDRDELTAAGALLGLRGSLGMVVGPAVAGILIATIHLTGAYLVDIASFGVSLVALSMMKAVPPPPDAERPSLRRMKEGLQYAVSRQELLGTYVVDMVAMFFGMPIALFPAIASHHGDPAHIMGFLTAAPAVGSLLATATSGWTSRVHRHGKAIVIAASCWGLAMVLFGLTLHHLWLSLFFLACAGAGDMVSGLFRQTIWNQTIPDALRGRLAGIELISYSSGPALSGIESGVVQRLFTLRTAVVSGGALCVAGAGVCAQAMPTFWAYSSKDGADPGAAEPSDPGSLAPDALQTP